MSYINREKIPNLLTFLRFVFAILVIFLLAFERYTIASFFFLICSITDWLDGFWARKWKVESNFGKVMDPLVDKLLVLPTLILLIAYGKISIITTIFIVIIILRDVLMLFIRRFYVSKKKIVIPAITAAKIKTCLQMVGIFIILFVFAVEKETKINPIFNWWEFPLLASTIFSAWSLYLYFKNISEKNKNKETSREIAVDFQEIKD